MVWTGSENWRRRKDLIYDNGMSACFVQLFLTRFLTEGRRNKMQKDFYMRVQGESEPGEAYIHAKIQLWRKLQLDEQGTV